MGDGSGDLLPPEPERVERRPRAKDLTCGFCETTLSPGGEVMRLSARAKALRDFEDDLEDERATITELRAEIEQLRQQIADRDGDIRKLQNDLAKSKKFW